MKILRRSNRGPHRSVWRLLQATGGTGTTVSVSRKRRQCKQCPWKVSTDPRKIPRGYSKEKHCALARTIAKPGDVSRIGEPLHIMACHDADKLPCVGWLANQIGPGNNIQLRLKARAYGEFQTVGKQHERFEDTLP